jgi:AcrR family transcriptional regulator
MTTASTAKPKSRAPLSRERVLEAAIAFADEHGIEKLSMRKLGGELGVEAMSLYYHVANKEEILDGMVDHVIGEIGLQPAAEDWKVTLREQIFTARRVMKRHPWAPEVIESRSNMSFATMRYMDAIGGLLRQGGFSVDLMHHSMHALGSRVLGFSQELYDDSDSVEAGTEAELAFLGQVTSQFPNIASILEEIQHQEASIVGSGCDDDIEFGFALDILLDGLERKRNEEQERVAQL